MHTLPNIDKMRLKIKEASQQCGRLSLPEIKEKLNLTFFIKNVKNAIIIWLDERKNAESILSLLGALEKQEIFVVLGPEGGFSAGEQQMLESYGAMPVKLANNVLRAETAGIVAVACLVNLLM